MIKILVNKILYKVMIQMINKKSKIQLNNLHNRCNRTFLIICKAMQKINPMSLYKINNYNNKSKNLKILLKT